MNKKWYIVDENGYPIAVFDIEYIAKACQKYFNIKSKIECNEK